MIFDFPLSRVGYNLKHVFEIVSIYICVLAFFGFTRFTLCYSTHTQNGRFSFPSNGRSHPHTHQLLPQPHLQPPRRHCQRRRHPPVHCGARRRYPPGKFIQQRNQHPNLSGHYQPGRIILPGMWFVRVGLSSRVCQQRPFLRQLHPHQRHTTRHPHLPIHHHKPQHRRPQQRNHPARN